MLRITVRTLIEKCLSLPLAAQLLLAVNVGALLFALTMQYGFGIRPCYLCTWARVPYSLVALFSFLVLAAKPTQRQVAVLLGLCVVAYLAGTGIAIFHTGVEQHWWEGTASCAALPLEGASPEELRQALLAAEEPRCDVISWTIFGFSMANLNIAASLGLAFFAAATMVRHIRRK